MVAQPQVRENENAEASDSVHENGDAATAVEGPETDAHPSAELDSQASRVINVW